MGISPTEIDYSLGIAKAYTTRVGEGPFPTELFDSIGKKIAKKGGEVGATTGRPRRCGWLDAVLLSHAVRINGINGLCITKIDILDGFDEVKICTKYNSKNDLDDLLEAMDIDDVEAIYETFPGWKETTAGCKRYEDLPQNAKNFISIIEEICGVPVIMISTGPERGDTIIRDEIIK